MIAVLKKQKPQPKIPPNKLDKPDLSNSIDGKDGKGKRPGSVKKNKTGALQVVETRQILLENIPPGAKFKGWADYIVQVLTNKNKKNNVTYVYECVSFWNKEKKRPDSNRTCIDLSMPLKPHKCL